MRITNGIMQNNMMNSLNTNMSSLNKLMTQMNTMKKIERPSDDPIIAGRGLKLRINVMEAEQHSSNVDEATSWMSVSETALSNITDIIKTMRERCVQGANGTLTTEDKEKVMADIEQLYQQVKQEANTTYAGRYVFSGYKTDQPVYLDEPHTMKQDVTAVADVVAEDGTVYTAGTVIPKGTVIPAGSVNPEVLGSVGDQTINYEVGVNNMIDVNTKGVPQFMQDLLTDMEDIMGKLEGAMAEPPTVTEEELNQAFTDMIGKFDGHQSTVSEMTSDLGSRQKRLEFTKERLESDKTDLTELLSETENVDIEEVYVQFNTQYMVYQSALQASSKIVMNTLADFLA